MAQERKEESGHPRYQTVRLATAQFSFALVTILAAVQLEQPKAIRALIACLAGPVIVLAGLTIYSNPRGIKSSTFSTCLLVVQAVVVALFLRLHSVRGWLVVTCFLQVLMYSHAFTAHMQAIRFLLSVAAMIDEYNDALVYVGLVLSNADAMLDLIVIVFEHIKSHQRNLSHPNATHGTETTVIRLFPRITDEMIAGEHQTVPESGHRFSQILEGMAEHNEKKDLLSKGAQNIRLEKGRTLKSARSDMAAGDMTNKSKHTINNGGVTVNVNVNHPMSGCETPKRSAYTRWMSEVDPRSGLREQLKNLDRRASSYHWRTREKHSFGEEHSGK